MRTIDLLSRTFLAVLFCCGAALCCPAQEITTQETTTQETTTQETTTQETTTQKIDKLVDGAIGFLRKSQADDGSFSSEVGTGVTALAAAGMMQNGVSPDDDAVAKALEWLLQHVQADGGIYAEGSTHRNYETCIAILCFHEANQNGKYDKLLADAEAFVKRIQWQPGMAAADPHAAGGAGYGNHSRPDLSNTAFLVEALHTLGKDESDAAIQRALVFVSRCQNLETKYNDTKYASKNPDGGFYYTIAAGGSSQAGETDDGGLRSYGSMTYAGLKSMLYAGVKADDPRVKAALGWAQQHYRLDENPGMGASGLYYYYQTFAKALAAVGEKTLVDQEGNLHDWRQDLVDVLAANQKPDGSWVNEAERWLESDPNLVTGYVLMALANCR